MKPRTTNGLFSERNSKVIASNSVQKMTTLCKNKKRETLKRTDYAARNCIPEEIHKITCSINK